MFLVIFGVECVFGVEFGLARVLARRRQRCVTRRLTEWFLKFRIATLQRLDLLRQMNNDLLSFLGLGSDDFGRKFRTRCVADKCAKVNSRRVNGYADSAGLRDTLAADCIELIYAHRKNRKRPKRQDSRKLRRAKKRRWRVERANAWLHNIEQCSNRYERRSDIYLGFVQLACLFTIIKRFLNHFIGSELNARLSLADKIKLQNSGWRMYDDL